ncbi:substrate-binding domain-containing protein [Kineococcus glutinatus]|uniref:Substrate-binding domain-containing protein n=1 Tax=Kineococcus glutinatus TaxID=1070872 RepID=A0ABP9HBB3_9ACTN
MTSRARSRLLGALVVPALLVAACGGGSGSPTGDASAAGAEPVTVGVVTATSGALASYGRAYLEGLEAGLDHATDGTGEVGGRPVRLEVVDDAGAPDQAVAAATELVGRGVKILVGTVSSGVAVQLAPFAEENDLLYVSGPAAVDAVTGVNRNTFRSGRQTYQDVAAAASLLADPRGTVLVLGQDTAFGQGNVAAVQAVLGARGATVEQLLVPATANDFTPFAQQIRDRAPDLLFVAWAGDTSAAMWQSLQQQGVFEATEVTTGLGDRATWPAYGQAPQDIAFLAHYVPGAADTEADAALRERVAEPDLFTPDGFVAAQMVVRALQEGDPEDTASMIEALEGWEFEAPKGTQTIRASDHAMLQPMFTARLTGTGETRQAELVEALDADAVAPPEAGQ